MHRLVVCREFAPRKFFDIRHMIRIDISDNLGNKFLADKDS